MDVGGRARSCLLFLIAGGKWILFRGKKYPKGCYCFQWLEMLVSIFPYLSDIK